MSKIAVVADSTTDLGKEKIEGLNINVVPLQIQYKDGRSFRDGVDIDVFQVAKDLDEFEPKTSLPAIQDAVDAFNKLEEEGYTHCIVLPLSSGLSGTYNMFVGVADAFEGKMEIEIIDGRTVSVGMSVVIEEIVKNIDSGMAFKEVVSRAKEKCESIKIYFAIETLKYLQRGGRISKVEGTVGSVLDIKPIIEVNAEGKLNNVAKVRGRKKSILKLVELFKLDAEKAKNKGKKVSKIYIVHGNRQEDGEYLKTKMEEAFPEIKIDVVCQLGALLTVHTGEGTIGAVMCWEDK